MAGSRLPRLSARLQGSGTTVFSEMTALALEHDAVNLGQGFPDEDAPEPVKDAATRAIRAGHNQYAPGRGTTTLREAVAEHVQRFHGVEYDPDDEVTATAGATEGVFAAVQALCDVGDEVVLFEPYYDAYAAAVSMAGAVPRVVRLRDPELTYDGEVLRRIVGPRTRVLILNTPHNPTGKVWSEAELSELAEVCVAHDLVVITDEVYEHLVFEGEHLTIGRLPGMRERTVRVSSAAKTFSVTGWKTGWVCAPPDLTGAVRTAKQWVTFTNGTPFQLAVGRALRMDDAYFAELRRSYGERRELLVDALTAVGFDVVAPAGTYFVIADIRPLGFTDDVAFCRMLPERYGVAAVPVSGFHLDPGSRTHLVRFAFCKSRDTLEAGIARLRSLP
jgi:N-succinyldiaminopimelate aminotransferase